MHPFPLLLNLKLFVIIGGIKVVPWMIFLTANKSLPTVALFDKSYSPVDSRTIAAEICRLVTTRNKGDW